MILDVEIISVEQFSGAVSDRCFALLHNLRTGCAAMRWELTQPDYIRVVVEVTSDSILR